MKIEELREEASKLIKKTNGDCIAMRSCWKCNPAHEHFKRGMDKTWVLWCFGCGHYFYKGKDITIIDK
jgi:hypothetical protein